MTQEDKQLLLKDLCARLPYGVNAQGTYEEEADYNTSVNHDESVIGYIDGIDHIGFDDGEIYVAIEGIPCELSNVRLYLHPMSSMTEEERKNFIKCAGYEVEESENGRHYDYYLKDFCGTEDAPCANVDAIDWLNAHHFDYRGLIEKGLAIEVTKDNNPYKE